MDLKNKLKIGLSVLRYQLTGKRTPIAIAWLITGRCNLNCRYCYWKRVRETKELDTAAVKDMIDQMRRAGVRLISFTGGEPLVRKDMGEIIRHVKSHGLVCKMNTNGMFLESRLDDVRPLDLLQISVDGPPDLQDRLRGEGTSEKAARAVQTAREAGIHVQMVACLTRDNVARLDEVLDYGLDVGVGFCFQIVNPAHTDPNEQEGFLADRERLVEALEYLVGLCGSRDRRARAVASKKSELQYYLDLVKSRRRGCECTLVTATMLPDGRLIFCGVANNSEPHDAVELGFAEAFSRLTIPDCDGCTCVGKLRLSKVYQLDVAVVKEMLGF
ncbi:MAG: radical SAM protein [Planctomycetota bacterium]|jgi:MoaA/NifB/PqqE/SkfB family radical SAM enzyme